MYSKIKIIKLFFIDYLLFYIRYNYYDVHMERMWKKLLIDYHTRLFWVALNSSNSIVKYYDAGVQMMRTQKSNDTQPSYKKV